MVAARVAAAGVGKGSWVSGDGFVVVADSLMRAVTDIRVVADWVRDGTVEGLDDGVSVGHDRLQGVLGDFCARWNQGVKDLIHGDEDIATSLRAAVEDYLRVDDAAAGTFAELMDELGRAGW